MFPKHRAGAERTTVSQWMGETPSCRLLWELELRLVLGAGNICALSYLHMITIRTIG
jgi:hypothetical protein